MLGSILLFLYFIFTVLYTMLMMSLITPLPISDTGTVRYRTIPWATITLIIVNALVFLLWQARELYQAETVREFYPYIVKVYTYGFRAAHVTEPSSIGAFTSFTSMFMHGDMWHLFGNMIYLWAFGRRVEDACGPWRYLSFYLMAGLVANLFSVLLNRSAADLPGIGASGAISGIMGAYLVMFPGARVTCMWAPAGTYLRIPFVWLCKKIGVPGFKDAQVWKGPMWSWLPFKNTIYFLRNCLISVPAWMLLFFYLYLQIGPSLDVIEQGNDVGGVNTLAHLTGFLAALAIFLYVRKDLLLRYFSGRSL